MSRLPLHPIDETATSGRRVLIGDGSVFALARWNGERFEFASGYPVKFKPTGYYRTEAHRAQG